MPLCEAFGFTNIRVEGFEADDVIATLTKRAREQGIEVMVVSGDRDVYQLVEDGVRVMTTSRGVTDTKIYDTDGVVERYGVPPELVTDLIGLKGDTSDNIPGVPGIGDKTAARCCRSSARSRRCSPTSTRSPAPSARRTSPTTPTTPASRSSSRRWTTTSTPSSTSTIRCGKRRTAAACATSRASSSCGS